MNRRKGNNFKNNLIDKGYIRAKEVKLSIGRIMLFELTEKGKQFLEKLGYPVCRDRNGVEHRFWKWKIAQYYRKRGYKVFIEKRINGAVDVAVKKDNMSIAVEIETGKSDFMKNILTDLKAGYDMVISVATDESIGDRIRQKLRAENLDRVRKISVTTVRAFE